MRRLISFAPLSLATLMIAGFPCSAAHAKGVVLDRLEASVNNSLIFLSDVTQFRKTIALRGQLDPLFSGSSFANSAASASDHDIVQFLVDEKVITSQFPVKDPEVEQEINSIQANNRISRDNLKAALRQQGFAFEDYFELIRASISKRGLIERDIRTKVFISDDDVKNYFYNQNPSTGKNVSYRIKIITVTPGNYKTQADARKAIQKAHAAVQAGEPFEEVAKRISDDPSSATGGELGTLSEEEMSAQIRKEIKPLKVGQTSGILGSDSTSYFILKLVDIKSSQDDKLNALKEQLRGQLAAKEYAHQIELWIQRERQKAFIHIAHAK
ncbi:MAG: peptidylprolyl isomerase [Bacteriovoracia bacterium]